MADVLIAKSRIHGVGVFAKHDLAEGELILAIDDSRIVDKDHPLQPDLDEYEYQCDYLAHDTIVLMKPPECFINSSCDPNAFVKTVNGTRHVIARRFIKSGEEITYDYAINFDGGEVWQCHCRAPRCSGFVASSFFDLPTDLQMEYLPLLDSWFIGEHLDRVEALRQHAGTSRKALGPAREISTGS